MSCAGEVVRKFPRYLVRRLRFLILPLLVCAGLLAFIAPSAFAFGCQAHEVVALIAEKHLSPRAMAAVQQLLLDNPIDPALGRYCQQPNLDPFAYSSTWADDYRAAHRETADWHQIDIPIAVNATKGDLAPYCPPPGGCVTQAIKDQIALLRSPDVDAKTKADALRYIIHFVGDIHAPLHTADNNDLGGNCVPVNFFGDEPKMTNEKFETFAPNLHGMWDYGIYQREFSDKSMPPTSVEYKSGYHDRTVTQAAEDFNQKFAPQIVKWLRGSVDEDAWAWESFGVAKAVVYGKLPVAIPVEKPIANHSCSGDDHISTRMLDLNEKLDQRYQDAALPVLEEQVAKAGARLALVLNQIWP